MNIDPRMTKLRSQLVINHPFFGFLASRLQIIEAPGIGTMVVDGKRWFYDPVFLNECNEPKLIFVGAHEVMHCALNHPTRRQGRDPELWNISADHVVNLTLGEAGFMVPTDALCDRRFKGMSVDDVYRILHAEQQQEKDEGNADSDETEDHQSGQSDDNNDGDDSDSGQDNDDDGSPDGRNSDQSSSPDQYDPNGNNGSPSTGNPEGADDGDASDSSAADAGSGNDLGNSESSSVKPPTSINDPGRCGGVIDAAPEHDQSALDDMAEEWNVAVRQAINLARRQGEGRLPGFLEEVVKDINTPKVDWRETLRAWIDPSSTKDYTWAKLNRRMLPFDIISPGTTADGINHVGIVVDDSASISSEILKQFAGETQSALDDGKIDKVTVVFCDDRVQRTAEYVMGDVIDFIATGRGGTRFSPAFKWFTDNEPDVSGVVYLTDMDSSDHGPEPHYRVLWAAYEQPVFVKQLRLRMANVPFGECIELN